MNASGNYAIDFSFDRYARLDDDNRSRSGSVVTILVPDNIPIWGNIQKVSEYHTVLG
jgi:hypothetical protein